MSTTEPKNFKRAFEVVPIPTRFDNDIQRATEAGRYDVSGELMKMKTEEMKRMQDEAALEELRLTREKRLKEISVGLTELELKKRELKEQMSSKKHPEDTDQAKSPISMNFTGSELMAMMKDLNEEQRQGLFTLMAMTNTGGGGQSNNMGWMMPAMLGAMRQNPQMTPVDMVNMAASLINTVKGFAQPNEGNADLMKTMFTTLIDLVKNKTDKPEKGFWDTILGDKDKLNTVKEILGVGDKASQQQVTLEYAKINNDFELRKQELAQISEVEKQKVAVEQQRNQILVDGIGQAAEAIGAVVGSKTSESGEPAQMKMQVPEQAQAQIRSEVKNIPCPKCNAPVYVGNPMKGQSFKCTRCGNESTWE